ncbi:MAG: aspartate/glutamate racemase family protein [Phormidesmis sp.]
MQLKRPQWKKANKLSQQVAVPGILGGLGPLAHIELEKRMLRQRHEQHNVRCDQDYPTWLMVSATQTPDRTESLKRGANENDTNKNSANDSHSPCISSLQQSAQLLEKMGSDFLVVPCNTAHAFYGPVQAAINIPWLHLMDVTTNFIRQQYPNVIRVGVLATDGTLKARLYADSLRKAGFVPIEPVYGSLAQKQVMQIIYEPEWGIKTTGTQVSDRAIQNLSEAAANLYAEGAEVIIAGCTELSVACAQLTALPIPWVDPLQAIATVTLAYAYGDRALPLSGSAVSGGAVSSNARDSSPILNYAAL